MGNGSSCTKLVKVTRRVVNELDFDESQDLYCENHYLVPEECKVNLYNIPLNIQYKDTEPFIPPVEFGIVIKVYDGDTITVAARMPIPDSPIYRFQVRLEGIDTPEIRADTKDEKDAANKAKVALSDIALSKYVELRNVKKEKYGRLLATVWCNGINLNEWLIKNRYAVPYDGGKKNTPKSWKRYKKTGRY
jgi:endonuclease YncB( thermonuclease family)